MDAATCRHDFILRYFGDEAESLGGCGHCDVCRDVEARAALDPAALDEDRDVIRRALAGVARARGSAGLVAVAGMLAGEQGPRLARMGLDRLSTFGVLSGRTRAEVMTVLRVLLANGWIDLSEGDFPMPVITASGWKVLAGEIPVRVRLPRARPLAAAPSAATTPSARKPRAPRVRPAPAAGALEGTPLGPEEQALFQALAAHRVALARVRSVPVYVIAPNRTLTEIARLRPRSVEDLGMVHGMGPGRIAAYGEGFLGVVRGVGGGRDAGAGGIAGRCRAGDAALPPGGRARIRGGSRAAALPRRSAAARAPSRSAPRPWSRSAR